MMYDEPKFKVIRADFEGLESVLTNLHLDYPDYRIFEILSEHCYDGALAVVILKRFD